MLVTPKKSILTVIPAIQVINQRNVQRGFEQEDRVFEENIRQYDEQFKFSQQQYADALKQRDWERAFAEKQRQDQIKQQKEADAIAWYNAKTSRSRLEAEQGGANTFEDKTIPPDAGQITGVPSGDGKNRTYTLPNGDTYIIDEGVNPYTGTKNPDA